MATAYWTIAGITFVIVFLAFLSDREANKQDLKSYIFVAAATLLWPITLPFILRKKYLTVKAHQQARKKARVLRELHNLAHSSESASVMSTPLQVTD